MTLGVVCPDDIVLADVKGRRFYAIVIARRERELEIRHSPTPAPEPWLRRRTGMWPG
jgi:hypothetical protein